MDRGPLTDQQHQAPRPNQRRKRQYRSNWCRLTSHFESLEISRRTELLLLRLWLQSFFQILAHVQRDDRRSHSRDVLVYQLLCH